MATSVTLPALGESVTEGTVTQWLKQVGDTVAVDEPLLEISTDKVDTEIPSPVAGVLLEIKANEDDTVEVGAVLAIIGDEGESADGDAAPAEAPVSEENVSEEVPAEQAPADETPAEQPVASSASEERSPAPEGSAEAEQAAAENAPAPQAEAKPTSGGTAVTLPALGESVTEGTVTQWLKQVGDDVAVDEPLLEISTDKVDTEIPSPVAGKLLEIKVAEDETVEVGAELAIIGTADAQPAAEPEEAPAPEAEPEPAPEPAAAPEPAVTPEPAPVPTPEPAQPESQAQPEPAATPAPAAPRAESNGGGDTYVTPIVRKLAKQHDVDLAAVTGTGVGGRIRKQDVLDAVEKSAPAAESAPAAATDAPASGNLDPSPLRGKTEKLSRLRRTIATRMHESLQVSAQLTTVVEIDVTEIARLRARTKDAFFEREGVKLSFLPFFAKAAIEALKTYPQVNSSLDLEAGTVTYPAGEHLGVAVETPKGLLVPVIRDAGDLNIAGIARKIADVADRTRNNKILPDELSGGTFTLTNTGSRGALFDTPIINQPQVAILGTGAVVKRPVVITDPHIGESIAVRQMVYFALTYDHRIVDGADAARFLTAIKDRLEGGSFEGELGS
ncbi:2-oxoglutarate dehydrogenase, E2 component, dihydrolipoamide succinyltransferase [Aeromicrobium sp. A1-2]|uniref:2-oxoglutarate dehydrogenase, E2 component, dihydrolipoamide succinyltransferase n=1 Tax=Aeromicrobium sp. A1-2 TaxID=2107713 RepID=UPI000E52A607|nr:2-oxoglutarate dehydrogenase, E2 component, dihydrolipoamide succinyltransferase [Aeromicrobium sp. A1-2]AXT84680.1 2-oxoglutarate dehydrogenase, E2 component, dihydrolipoamide succinyltransferase [Aeromicrobium sp. A1-2]